MKSSRLLLLSILALTAFPMPASLAHSAVEPVPRPDQGWQDRHKLINQVLHKLANGKDVFWIDFGHKFLNADGTLPRELMPDFLHLSQKGYEIWADSIEGKLSELLDK